MIDINCGVLTIGADDRYLGLTGDNLNKTKEFKISDVADENASYELHLNFCGGKEINILLDKKVENGSTKLFWKIQKDQLLADGLVIARVKACLSDSTTFFTTHDFFYVALDYNKIMADNSFVENTSPKEFEKEMSLIRTEIEQLRLDYVSKSRSFAGLDLSTDRSKADVQKALKTYPVIFTTQAPTISTKGEIGQLMIVTTANLKETAPIYICRSITTDEDTGEVFYTWQQTGGDTSIETVGINEVGELVFTFKDGSLVNLGVVVGKDGVDGKDGEHGINGENGLTPRIGSNGNWFIGSTDTGFPSKGAQGEQGIQGVKGDKGDTGAQGPQGAKGEKGDTGAQGPQGAKGEKGDTGAQGPQGAKGADGKTPVKGVDYFTQTEKNALLDEVIDKVNVTESKLSDFIRNTDIDYAYDSATGANYTIIRIYKNKVDGTKQYPFVYAPNGKNSGTLTTYDLSVFEGWLFAINAGVFDTTDCTPDGIVIQNGIVVQKGETTTHSQCKPLTINSNGDLGFAEYNASASDLVSNGIVSAVTGFIPIIVDYNAVPSSEFNSVSHYTENAQRQIIGQFGNGDYAIITCEGRNFDNSDGWTIAEAQTICQKHGLKFAYNLDGGGSTETMLGKKHINTIYEGITGRKVPTFIVFNGTTAFDGQQAVPEPEIVIPDGYTQVEYLQTTGAQYINTGIPETNIYSVEYKALNEYLHAQAGHLLSSANTYISFTKWFEGESTEQLITKYKGKEHQIDNTGWVDVGTEPYIIKDEYDGTNIVTSFNGVTKYSLAVGTTALASNMYHLFTYGGNTSATQYRFTGKFYYMIMRDLSGNKVHHFVPVKDSNGVYGLYDVVTNTFYDSDTNVAFTGA